MKKAVNIFYDTDGETILGLPKSMTLPEYVQDETEAQKYISRMVGFPAESFHIEEIQEKENESLDVKKDLGSFTVDVKLQPNGLFDVWIAHEGSSGCHYTDMTADKIGEYVADEIECVAENYQ